MTSDPLMLPSTSSLQEAAASLLRADASEVIVLDRHERICGLVSDLLRADPLTLSPDDGRPVGIVPLGALLSH